MRSKHPVGIAVLAVMLIAGSLINILKLFDFGYYRYLFQPLPGWLIFFRYFISWALKITGIIAGIGILRLKDTYRKLAIYLFIFTICTIYWKHPFFGFARHTAYMDRIFNNSGFYQALAERLPMPSFSSLANVSAIVAQVIDVLFAAICIYYFTRPKVKGQFKQA